MKHTIANKILVVLAEGPAVPSDVAVSLGMPQRLINAHMSALYARGRLTRMPYVKPPGTRGRKTVWMYAPRGRRGVPA